MAYTKSRNANACLQHLELHRLNTHATVFHLQRWKMGRGGSEGLRARLHRSMAAPCQTESHEAFPGWRRHPSLRNGSACLQGCALPAPVCNTAVRREYRRAHWTKIRGMSMFNGSSAPSLSVGTSALQRGHPAMLAAIDWQAGRGGWADRVASGNDAYSHVMVICFLCRLRVARYQSKSNILLRKPVATNPHRLSQ